MVSPALADGSPFGGPRLSSANSVWVEQTFQLKSSFQEIVEKAYKAVIRSVDFRSKVNEARKEVNKWAEKETEGLIKEILSPGSVDERTGLILANAVFFKGAWNHEFKKSLTKNHEFFLLNGTSVQAPFMTNYNMQSVRSFDEFKVLRIPYRQGEDTRSFSMCILLPNAVKGLPSLIEKVCSESGFIERHLPHEVVEMNKFLIPKFKIAFDFEASGVLKGQGLELPFRPVGDFTEMLDSVDGKLLYVSEIFHKAFIEVNEEGTKAVAVSSLRMQLLRSRFPPKVVKMDFVADHPFLFVIREDTTGVVLFVGQVLDPLAG